VTVDYYSRDGLVRGRADTALGGTTVYIHLGNTLVAEDARAWRRSFGLRYLHTDVIGTPIAKTDEAGSVIERDRRQSFGQPFAGSLQKGLGFTGHMEDPGTGLVYMQQRYYDPAIARFLSVDPVGPLDNPINHFGRYHYAYNNPYRFTDPDGRAPGSRIGCGGESKGPCDPERQSRAPADSRDGGTGDATTAEYGADRAAFFPKVEERMREVESFVVNQLAEMAVGLGAGKLIGKGLSKIPRSGISAKEAARDIPSWARGERPLIGENGRTFAARLLDEKYGKGSYPRGAGSEFSKLQKWADRAFEDPPG